MSRSSEPSSLKGKSLSIALASIAISSGSQGVVCVLGYAWAGIMLLPKRHKLATRRPSRNKKALGAKTLLFRKPYICSPTLEH